MSIKELSFVFISGSLNHWITFFVLNLFPSSLLLHNIFVLKLMFIYHAYMNFRIKHYCTFVDWAKLVNLALFPLLSHKCPLTSITSFTGKTSTRICISIQIETTKTYLLYVQNSVCMLCSRLA